MNWDAIGAIGEILGALAVVATLGYLAVQIRQSTAVARASTRQAIAEMSMASASDVVTNPELAEIEFRNMKGEALGEVDRMRIYARAYTGMRHWENIHYQYLSGMLTEDEWRGFRANLKALMQWESRRRYWEHEKHYYSQNFQAEIATIISENQSSPAAMEHSYVFGGLDSPESINKN
jgi:hypothetical protein